jgi:hypothetical protein
MPRLEKPDLSGMTHRLIISDSIVSKVSPLVSKESHFSVDKTRTEP